MACQPGKPPAPGPRRRCGLTSGRLQGNHDVTRSSSGSSSNLGRLWGGRGRIKGRRPGRQRRSTSVGPSTAAKLALSSRSASPQRLSPRLVGLGTGPPAGSSAASLDQPAASRPCQLALQRRSDRHRGQPPEQIGRQGPIEAEGRFRASGSLGKAGPTEPASRTAAPLKRHRGEPEVTRLWRPFLTMLRIAMLHEAGVAGWWVAGGLQRGFDATGFWSNEAWLSEGPGHERP